MPASAISDRWGRKPVLLFGTTGVAVAVGLFGMSTEYWMMIITRCIGGGIGGASTYVDSARSASKAHFSLNNRQCSASDGWRNVR